MKCHIEEYIVKSGLRKGFIAEKLNISPTQLSNVIAGRSYLRTPNLFKLAHLLGVKVDDLYEYKEEDEQ